jgi:predicted AAA+ superfamily ATPase
MQIGSYNSNMQGYIPRKITRNIRQRLEETPAVAIIGARQSGKTTLSRKIIESDKSAIYLDLEKTSDRNKLQDPEAYFSLNADRLICLDEIQRAPDLFPLMRAIIDESNRNGQFLILGSASPGLLKQSSETLAGRISYIGLTPFLLTELRPKKNEMQYRKLWLKGGFPRSFLARSETSSLSWRLDFIQTFLERDIPQLGFNIPARRLERLWRMIAHLQGQLLNSSKLGESLGVSHHTIRTYAEMLEQTFMLRSLKPFAANLKKRLVKSPKIYIRDTGLLHALLDIETQNDLLGHPVYGASWESFVIENIIASYPDWRPHFYRSSAGAEIDLILEKGMRRIAVECKVSTAPHVNRGFWNALEDLAIKEAWIIAPVKDSYPIRENVFVSSLEQFMRAF